MSIGQNYLQLLYRLLNLMKAPETAWANSFSSMQNLVQHNEIYEALFITGVVFSLSLHSSYYFI
jgi:hypothetical protein